ncbi:MAG: lycopene cyclase domain-containing protein [Saprospiraceae bacterium]
MKYAWLIWSLIALAFWGYTYWRRPSFRKEMGQISWLTMLFGLTEPLFVPEYWAPPSLFNLADKTGFDIESFLFSFAIGGIGAVLYRLVFPANLSPFDEHEKQHARHRMHRVILFLPVAVFLVLAVFTGLNHIYCGVIALFLGGVATLYCRPDLKYKIWVGGLLFLALYAVYFGSLLLFFPDFVDNHWNLAALTGIKVIGIPLEELLFAFTFGMYWSGLYEHLFWYQLKPDNSLSHA